VKWVRDTSGRLPERPHYLPAELEGECEALVARFLRARHGAVRYPLSTDDLAVLLESEVDDLDLYADFSAAGAGVEGVTEFSRRGRPVVRISAQLSESASRAHRLRTTLAHELGHVRLHAFLWREGGLEGVRCHRDTIARPRLGDWLEWQAGYACGAFLVPKTALDAVVREFAGAGRDSDQPAPLFFRTAAARALARRVQCAFDISAQAAQVRLAQAGFVTREVPPALSASAGVRAFRPPRTGIAQRVG
jgi:Zn-dependent peptidase ImmA (M78 family)